MLQHITNKTDKEQLRLLWSSAHLVLYRSNRVKSFRVMEQELKQREGEMPKSANCCWIMKHQKWEKKTTDVEKLTLLKTFWTWFCGEWQFKINNRIYIGLLFYITFSWLAYASVNRSCNLLILLSIYFLLNFNSSSANILPRWPIVSIEQYHNELGSNCKKKKKSYTLCFFLFTYLILVSPRNITQIITLDASNLQTNTTLHYCIWMNNNQSIQHSILMLVFININCKIS